MTNSVMTEDSAAYEAALSRFVKSQEAPGPMLADFCNHPKVLEPDAASLDSSMCFEFPWGFVLESRGFGGGGFVSDFYVQKVWQSGTENWWDRFLTAHKNIVHAEMGGLYDQTTGKGILISFDDGISNYSCASYACLDPHSAPVARHWFAQRLLKHLWPAVLEAALNPDHQFATNWRCT